jgi:hypothetical protein
MDFKQCDGIILRGWTASGQRTGLVPPRRCRRPALEGQKYCEGHQPQADLQDLLHECFGIGWELRVEAFFARKARQAEPEARSVIMGMRALAEKAGMMDLAGHLDRDFWTLVKVYAKARAKQPSSWGTERKQRRRKTVL